MLTIALLPPDAEMELRQRASGCLRDAYTHHEFVAWMDSGKRCSAAFDRVFAHDFYLYLAKRIRQAIPEVPSWWPVVITPDEAERLRELLDTLVVSSLQPLQDVLHYYTATHPIYTPAKALDVVTSICREMSNLVEQRLPGELIVIHEYDVGEMK